MDKLDVLLGVVAVVCQLLIGAMFVIEPSPITDSGARPEIRDVHKTLQNVQESYLASDRVDVAATIGTARAMLLGLQARTEALEAEKRTDAVLGIVSCIFLSTIVLRLHAKTRSTVTPEK